MLKSTLVRETFTILSKEALIFQCVLINLGLYGIYKAKNCQEKMFSFFLLWLRLLNEDRTDSSNSHGQTSSRHASDVKLYHYTQSCPSYCQNLPGGADLFSFCWIVNLSSVRAKRGVAADSSVQFMSELLQTEGCEVGDLH